MFTTLLLGASKDDILESVVQHHVLYNCLQATSMSLPVLIRPLSGLVG